MSIRVTRVVVARVVFSNRNDDASRGKGLDSACEGRGRRGDRFPFDGLNLGRCPLLAGRRGLGWGRVRRMGGRDVESGTTAVHHLALLLLFLKFDLWLHCRDSRSGFRAPEPSLAQLTPDSREMRAKGGYWWWSEVYYRRSPPLCNFEMRAPIVEGRLHIEVGKVRGGGDPRKCNTVRDNQ